jgi:uncharacterized phage protein (TIGR01671 family)
MREIKFRGKRIDNGEWVISYAIRNYGENAWENLKGKIYLLEDILNPKWIEVIPDTIGQYTGLKDKNDVEIYEGDFVEDKQKNIFLIQYDEMISGFYPFNVALSSIDEFDDINIEYISSSEYKKIGNIHDNPELLQKIQGMED